jgi:caa(3)-type oxidase subunit IV
MEHTPTATHGGTKDTYNFIFGVLFVATIFEVAVAELIGGGEFRAVLLLAATTAKAGLVAAYYMHLKYDPPILTWIFVVPMIVAAGVIISLQGLAGY